MQEKPYYVPLEAGENSLRFVLFDAANDGFAMPECHVHFQYEMLFIKEGVVSVENNNVVHDVSAPAVVFHRPYTYHRASCAPDVHYSRRVINFGTYLINSFSEELFELKAVAEANMTVISLTPERAERLNALLDTIAAEQSDRRRALVFAYVISFLAEFVTAENTFRSTVEHTYVDDVIEYIGKHYMRELRLEEIADSFFISRAKLVVDFKRTTGVTVRRYIISLRIDNAKLLLRSGKSVTETAEACGFGSDSHFISTFKEYTGVTPKIYSSMQRGAVSKLRSQVYVAK